MLYWLQTTVHALRVLALNMTLNSGSLRSGEKIERMREEGMLRDQEKSREWGGRGKREGGYLWGVGDKGARELAGIHYA